MANPIAAGTLVVARASLVPFDLESRRPLLGVCESATAPVLPGDPPTNVVVDWEDGTRVTYTDASGLIQSAAPPSPSLLGTVMQFGSTLFPLPFLNAGTRIRGPVVVHAQYFEPNGDPLGNVPSQDEIVTIKTPLGYMDFPVAGMVAVPGA